MAGLIRIGRFANLEIRAHRTTLWGSLALWAVLLLIGRLALNYTIGQTLMFGFVGLALHLASEAWHQIGHALAARSTGYPMKGFTFYWVLAASVYLRNEPELSARLHIRRALGGPAASFLVAVILAVVLRFVPIGNTVIFSLAVFFFLDNLLVFTIGSLLPLGFTDGSTLLHWWPRRGGR